jgi:5'(3')-deoxyribonucleotidase
VLKDTRLKLGIDVDGVLADFTTAYREVCEKIVGKPLPTMPTDWYQSNWGLTNKDHDKAWREVEATHNFYYHLKPLPESKFFNLQALDLTHRLYFITTRPPTKGLPIEVQTEDWLTRFFFLRNPTVIVTRNKGIVSSALEIDSFIDDRPENLLDIRTNSPNTNIFLMDQSWNKDYTGFSRVSDLSEFVSKATGVSTGV